MAIIENIPKYKQIKEILLERIHSGEYKSDSRFPTENELVREFGVSKHTILKTLGELVNEEILYRKQGAGTFVKNSRKNKKTGKSSSAIAFLYYGDTESDIPQGSSQLISGFGKGLQDSGAFEMNFLCTNGTPENEIKIINRISSSVKGIAILTHFREKQKHPAIDLLKEKKTPFVSMLAYPNSIYRDNISFVASDDFKGGTLAANYFKENKCNEIFVIMPSYGKYSIVNYDMRLAGIQNHWPNGKLNIINVEIENDSFAFEKAGYSAGSEIAKQIEPDKRTGIFAPMSDQVICGLLRRFGEEKHINRKNVLFCGYDNLSESNEWNNNFTSLEYSNLDIGHRAALLLLAKIKSGGNDAPDSEILPVKLIKRG